MKAFRYIALDPSGRRISALGYAEHLQGLRDQLIEARLHPLAIRPALFHNSKRLTLSASLGTCPSFWAADWP